MNTEPLVETTEESTNDATTESVNTIGLEDIFVEENLISSTDNTPVENENPEGLNDDESFYETESSQTDDDSNMIADESNQLNNSFDTNIVDENEFSTDESTLASSVDTLHDHNNDFETETFASNNKQELQMNSLSEKNISINPL